MCLKLLFILSLRVFYLIPVLEDSLSFHVFIIYFRNNQINRFCCVSGFTTDQRPERTTFWDVVLQHHPASATGSEPNVRYRVPGQLSVGRCDVVMGGLGAPPGTVLKSQKLSF